MRYHHVIAYRIHGIQATSLPTDVNLLEIQGVGARALLTPAPDPHLYLIDRGLAIATMMLKGAFGPRVEGEFTALLTKEIETIREARAEDLAGVGYAVRLGRLLTQADPGEKEAGGTDGHGWQFL